MSVTRQQCEQKTRPSIGRGGSFLVHWKPDSVWEVVRVHLIPFAASGALLLAALVIPLLPFGPRPCTFKALFGAPCPFCGSTRTFVDMVYGHWAAGWTNSPLAALLYIGCAGVFLWNGMALATRRRWARGARLRPGRNTLRLMGAAFAVALLLNWIYRWMSL